MPVLVVVDLISYFTIGHTKFSLPMRTRVFVKNLRYKNPRLAKNWLVPLISRKLSELIIPLTTGVKKITQQNKLCPPAPVARPGICRFLQSRIKKINKPAGCSGSRHTFFYLALHVDSFGVAGAGSFDGLESRLEQIAKILPKNNSQNKLGINAQKSRYPHPKNA
jgi:hypothetical protein